MCLPILTVLTTVAGAGMKIMETSANMAAQNKMAQQMAENARDAALADYNALNTRQMEVDQKTALEQTERARQAQREQGMATTMAAEGGIAGNSPMRQIANALITSGYDQGVHETNQQIQSNQIANEKFSVFTNAQGRVNEANSQVVSGWEAGLKLLGSGLSGAASGFDFGDKLKKKRFIY